MFCRTAQYCCCDRMTLNSFIAWSKSITSALRCDTFFAPWITSMPTGINPLIRAKSSQHWFSGVSCHVKKYVRFSGGIFQRSFSLPTSGGAAGWVLATAGTTA